MIPSLNLRFLAPAALVISAAALAPAQQAAFELKPGDRISIIGGGLADRLQHQGWLETLIHAKHPKHQLTLRNLAVAADEVDTWHRSQDFGSRDQWLTWTATDVIFAFYGFNESFDGYEGVAKFREQLDKFLKYSATQNYGGKGAPRIVLFSPIAAERHQDPNFPDPKEINERLANYVAVMADVAKANNVPFVDLYTPSLELYKQAAAKGQSLTINGIHLSDEGEKALAPVIVKALFGSEVPQGPALEKLHAAVLEKNYHWHQRYRTIDGYNVYGGRSREKYAPRDASGKTIGEPIYNNEVMQREMQQRDVLTANRDKRIWGLAQGQDVVVKDDNLPPPITVGTNKPGDKPDLSHTYPSGEEALAKIKVADNLKINLFADEKQFPELANPVQMAWDTKGRLWVAAWPNYPERTPTSKVGDKLLIFEDTDRDGKADKCTTFIDNLNGPTGFTFYKDGVLLMQAPDLWWVRDTDGDGKADWKERVLMGLDSADSHHTTNALNPDPGGAIYLSDGVFHRTQVETHEGPLRHSDGIIWRFEPRTGKFENYAPYGFANPHGKVFDYWGNDLITDATGNNTYFGPAFSGKLDNGKHKGLNEFWKRPMRPCPATGMISSRHFPDDWQGNFLNLNVIGFQGIYRVHVSQDGSGLKGETAMKNGQIDPLVWAEPKDLPTFRPICVSTGPDGALYFCDWAQTIIGHLQHHLRDPNRDHQHGRIYRITYEGRPLLNPPKIDGQPIEALLDILKIHEDDTRTLAKIELGKHGSAKVVAALKPWMARLDRNDPNYEHHLTEALWVHQWHNVVDVDLLKRMLKSPVPQARAAATRVLCYWRDRVPDALALLKEQAVDEDPRVRLHAVRAASFFRGNDVGPAMQVAYASLKKPGDYYLDYVFGETMRQLRSLTKDVVLPEDPEVLTTYLDRLSDGDLNKAPEVEGVLIARLERKSFDLAKREQALEKLAKLRKTDKVTELVAALERLDGKENTQSVAGDLAKMLALTPAAELAKARPSLVSLSGKAKQSAVRRAAWAAIIAADGNPQTTWAVAKDNAARVSLIDALGALSDPTLRAKFQSIVSQLAQHPNAPEDLRSAALSALPLMGADNAKANFPVIAAALKTGKDRVVAARAVMQLPRDAWAKDQAAPIAQSLLAWAKAVPSGERTSQPFIETLQVAQEMASLLPPADASKIRKELRDLSVSVFVIKTVHEQMRYDTPRIVVEAGKPFEVIFENVDMMPHNIVFVQPGKREEVATQAQNMAPDKLDKEGRAYVPDNKNIFGASKMLEAGQKQTLKLKAPSQEGEYEYVCTFPGHWMLMWGRLIVTKDVDAYLQANPQASLPTSGGAVAGGHQH